MNELTDWLDNLSRSQQLDLIAGVGFLGGVLFTLTVVLFIWGK